MFSVCLINRSSTLPLNTPINSVTLSYSSLILLSHICLLLSQCPIVSSYKSNARFNIKPLKTMKTVHIGYSLRMEGKTECVRVRVSV